jgi:WD40 repeat protein
MHTLIIVWLAFIVCPILALPFIIRIASAVFSKKSANQIRKHPIFHSVWGFIAIIGILAFTKGFRLNNPNPYDEPRYKISSWYVLPPFQLRPPLRAEYGGFYCIAAEAPIAVSASGSFLQIWKLGSFFQSPTPPLHLFNGIESLEAYQHPIAISPDGNIIAVASDSEYGLSVVDWKKGKILWETNQLEHEGYYGKHIIIGDGGKTLFTAGAHTVERWDLLSGEHHAILIKNEINASNDIRFLKTSSNGKVLIAGFGLPNWSGPLSFVVWDVDKNEPALKSEAKNAESIDVSPDGDWLAISKFGTTNLTLLKWRTGEQKEVPLQASHYFASVLWSPSGKYLAALVNSWAESITVYETANWKPVAHWKCNYPDGIHYEFVFGSNETLYQFRGNQLNAFEISQTISVDDN